jgi:ubiquinone/menaquinone biosynthesis C-methylase UbiE
MITIADGIEKQNIELYTIVHNESSDLESAKKHILHLLKENKFPFSGSVTMLDAGCGGRLAGLYYYQQLNIEKFIFCDINHFFVEKTLTRSKELGIYGEGYKCSVEKLPLVDISVDFIHCDGVLMHVLDYESALNEFQRTLKPGGYLLLGCYAYGGLLRNCIYPFSKIIRKIISLPRLARFISYTGILKSQDYSLLDFVYAPIQTLFTRQQINELLLKRGFFKVNIYKSFKRIFNISILSEIFFGDGYVYVVAQKK